jgi:enoyl-CoA hydratase
MTDQRILTERRGHVLLITINRPEARNAFDAASAEALEAVVDQIDADDSLFAAVITGAGGNFSAGADLKAAARGERAATKRGGFGLFAKPPKKPLIAAVEGFAVGGGFELCLPYHLAMEMALTGEFKDAEFLHRFGVVNRVVGEGEALEAAAAWAQALLVNGPTALAASKQIMLHANEWTDDEAWGAQMQYARVALESEDRKEGLTAFAEKRKPVWKGR